MVGGLRIAEAAHGVRVLTLDRPERRNAVDVELQEVLRAALDDAAGDVAVRGIVLTGADPAFSAGGDLSRFGDPDHVAFRAASHGLTELVSTIERIEKPVVAAVNGLATGVGTQLALACDLRYASPAARFVSREGHLGLLPSHGGISRLVALVGLGVARDVVLGGITLDAERAHALGLVTRVVPHDELVDSAVAHIGEIAQRSPDAYAVAKRVLGIVAGASLGPGLQVEELGQSLLVGTQEHRDRLRRLRDREGSPDG